MRPRGKNILGFTLTELLVSIVISVIVLGGVFYFISEALVGLGRSSAQSDFLKSFYDFRLVLNGGDFEILSQEGYDIGIFTPSSSQEALLLGVVNVGTQKLIPVSGADLYSQAAVAYRPLSSQEITNIESSPEIVYDMIFPRDKIFRDLYVADFSLSSYNSGSLLEMRMELFPQYYESLEGQRKSDIAIEDISVYSLVF